MENTIFTQSAYVLVEKTHSFYQNRWRFVESSKNPDFKFRDRKSGREFYVEAKFRSNINPDDKVTLFKPTQFDRFKSMDNKACPIFIVVGLLGSPDNPESVSLIPLHELKYPHPFQSILFRHRISKEPFSAERIQELISKHPGEVLQSPISAVTELPKQTYLNKIDLHSNGIAESSHYNQSWKYSWLLLGLILITALFITGYVLIEL